MCYGLINNRWYHIVVVTSGSMSPTIRAGDAIVISRPPEVLEKGMVVTMQVDGRVVTHRVIRVDADGDFVTQGDANPTADDWEGVTVRVVGVQRLRVPLLGKALAALGAVDRSGAFFHVRSRVGAQTTSCADTSTADPARQDSDPHPVGAGRVGQPDGRRAGPTVP